MASAIIDGITTRYEVLGDGPPLLMFSPGGFDATIEKWSTQGIYAKIKLLEHLPNREVASSGSPGSTMPGRVRDCSLI